MARVGRAENQFDLALQVDYSRLSAPRTVPRPKRLALQPGGGQVAAIEGARDFDRAQPFVEVAHLEELKKQEHAGTEEERDAG